MRCECQQAESFGEETTNEVPGGSSTLEMFDQEDSTSQNPNQKIDEANDIVTMSRNFALMGNYILGQWNFSGSASSCKGCIILISTTRLIVTFA